MAKRRRAESEASAIVDVPSRNERASAIANVAKEFAAGGWLAPKEALRRVRAVPTVFPQFDRAVRVGGLPIDRFTLVHGPSGHGKTQYVLGLGRSFLSRGHFFGFVDAELTTPFEWTTRLLGEQAASPGFVAMRPTTYEDTIAGVRRFTTGIGNAKKKGKIPEDTTGLIVVDSVKKLVPEKILDSILAEAKSGKFERGADGMRGMAGAMKAAMHAAWLDELTPLLYETGTALVAISRETEDREASPKDRKFGNDFKVGGGSALVYDSSLVVRVQLGSLVYDKESGDDGPRTLYGERHLLEIRKTKVAAKEEKAVRCYFHTSNGKWTPEGFDTARDVLELAEEYGIVKAGGGGWLAWGKKRWQGRHNAVKKLAEDAGMLGELETAVRSRFSADEALPEAEA